ncbi:hypothetical protein CEXT_591261 [Caerostris extrusa]|uniref:Uncharacterized protein n=1 Tax=Caerostris extrusa TaxID=172846 RepID=A0AAV4MUL5_CAEEX|nr:hypothetical protein CEXT_591261 [Caerostris extrusa]
MGIRPVPSLATTFQEINPGRGPMMSSPTNEMQKIESLSRLVLEGVQTINASGLRPSPLSSLLNAQCPSRMGWWRNGGKISISGHRRMKCLCVLKESS